MFSHVNFQSAFSKALVTAHCTMMILINGLFNAIMNISNVLFHSGFLYESLWAHWTLEGLFLGVGEYMMSAKLVLV